MEQATILLTSAPMETFLVYSCGEERQIANSGS
jgi:hypothetical protein